MSWVNAEVVRPRCSENCRAKPIVLIETGTTSIEETAYHPDADLRVEKRAGKNL